MVIVQCVVNSFALPAEPHQFAVLEHPELMAHGGLAQLHRVGDVLHAQLVIVERVQDLDAGGVAKYPEQVGQLVEHLVIGHINGLRGGGAFLFGFLLRHLDISSRVNFYMNVCSCVHDSMGKGSCQGVWRRILLEFQKRYFLPQYAKKWHFYFAKRVRFQGLKSSLLLLDFPPHPCYNTNRKGTATSG